METAVALRVLRLFNEKADRLLSRTFTRAIEQRFSVSYSWQQGEPLAIMTTGPSEEAIEAFVLTLRFFVQNNEPISLAKMAQLYDALDIDDTLKQRLHEARHYVIQLLASDTFINLNGHQVRNQRVFEVFLYGGLSHANLEKKAVYDSWTRDPLLFPLLQHEFITILTHILSVIAYIRALNEGVLAQLMQQSAQQ